MSKQLPHPFLLSLIGSFLFIVGTHGTARPSVRLQGAQSFHYDLSGASSYTYGTANLPFTAAEPASGWSQSYLYDAYGNMKYAGGQEFPGLSPLAFDPATNRISTPSGATGDGYSYDAAGNLTKGPGLREYSYDAEGRITEVKLSGSVIASYQYDGEGRRVREVKGSAVTYFVYDASGQKAAEYSTLAPEGTGTRYLTADHLGSIRLITDEALAARHCYDYKPFGEALPVAGSVRQTVSCYGAGGNSAREKFTGKERDGETGLDYFGARYLSGAQGRFTSPDSPGADWSLDDAQSWNLYSYVRNNPPRFIDPLGRKCVTLDGGGTGDDGAGEFCNDKGLKTSHGATVNGTSGAVDYFVYGNAIELGDIDLSGRKDFIIGYEPEDMMSARGAVRGLMRNPFRSGAVVVLDAAKRQRMNIGKPRLVTHPNRDPRSSRANANKTRQPADAEEVFQTAIPDPADPSGHKWWGKSTSGDIYRYQGSNGEVHFNGSESSGVRVPSNIKEWLK